MEYRPLTMIQLTQHRWAYFLLPLVDITVYTWGDNDVILSTIVNAVMLEVYLLQQYNVVSLCVKLYTSRNTSFTNNLQ